MARGKNRCVGCFKRHDQKFNFPDDYPNRLKLCCSCKGFAVQVILHGVEKNIDWFVRNYTPRKARPFIKRIKRIHKAITLA